MGEEIATSTISLVPKVQGETNTLTETQYGFKRVDNAVMRPAQFHQPFKAAYQGIPWLSSRVEVVVGSYTMRTGTEGNTIGDHID